MEEDSDKNMSEQGKIQKVNEERSTRDPESYPCARLPPSADPYSESPDQRAGGIIG